MAICRCRLSLLPNSWFLSLDSDLLATAMGATGSAWQKTSVHAFSTGPAACAGPACVQHALSRPDPQFLCCTRCTFCVIFYSLRFRHILITVYACNWSGPRICSGLPYNVMHSSSIIWFVCMWCILHICVLLLYSVCPMSVVGQV